MLAREEENREQSERSLKSLSSRSCDWIRLSGRTAAAYAVNLAAPLPKFAEAQQICKTQNTTLREKRHLYGDSYKDQCHPSYTLRDSK